MIFFTRLSFVGAFYLTQIDTSVTSLCYSLKYQKKKDTYICLCRLNENDPVSCWKAPSI